MNQKILIICAQLGEAESAIRRLNAQAVEGEIAPIWSEGHIPCCYDFDRGRLVLCNVGLHSAQMAVAKYGAPYQEIWNLGLAGALNDAYPLGTILSIDHVGKYIPDQHSLDERSQECLSFTLPVLHMTPSLSGTPGGALISSDFPIHSEAHRARLSHQWDLVDMEGYGIAFACSHLGKRCRMLKIVSDFASPGGRELIRKNRAALAEKIADTIELLYNAL